MAIIKKIKQESLLDKKRREIKEAIDLFNLDIVDYEVIIKKTPLHWEKFAKKSKFISFNLVSLVDDIGYKSEFTLTVQNNTSKDHNDAITSCLVMSKNNKKNEVVYPSLKTWEQHIKTISRYLLISPNSVLLTILSI
jgi:hypothetical protein